MPRDDVGNGWRTLREGDPVVFRPDACLIVRRPGAECGLCRQACPKGVLAGGLWSIALEVDGCIGCGVCAAACPTGALAVEGFAPEAAAPGGGVVLECARVAPADRAEGATVVPCLGGLTAPDLVDRAASGPVTVMDRGFCAGCDVGCGAQPWAAALAEATGLVVLVDPDLADRIAVRDAPLAIRRALPAHDALRPDLAARARLGRRDFFRAVVHPEPPATPLEQSRRVIEGRGLIDPVARRRILARLTDLAVARDRALPTALTPAIRLTDGCGLHGVCAAICPTGALRMAQGAGSLALTFEATDCIACNECQRACPTKALSLWPDGDGTAPKGRRTLAERASRACDACGDTFALDPGDETTCLCPICTKSAGLMQALSAWRAGCASS